MTLELVDESQIKKPDIKSDIKVNISCVATVKKSGSKLTLLLKEDIIECERVRLGMVDSCVLCQNLNKEIFGRCKNRYSDCLKCGED